MEKKFRIVIVGIGGVGGFLGGKLAAAYSHSTDMEIIFAARGHNAQAIRANGLKLITSAGEMIAYPDSIAEGSGDIGEIDLLICCTKAYDLESSTKALSSGITTHTIILPLLNGVDHTEKLQSLFPEAKVLQGCIYVVSKLLAPGIVQQTGDFYSLHFGGSKNLTAEMGMLIDLFEKADIHAVSEDTIHEKIWSKFSFISPVATYTSAYNVSIGKILESKEHTIALKKLMTELLELAKKMGIHLPADSIEKNFLVMEKLPYQATSSMQADFVNNKSTELETLTGFVVRKAEEQGIQLDSYEKLYELLSEQNR